MILVILTCILVVAELAYSCRNYWVFKWTNRFINAIYAYNIDERNNEAISYKSIIDYYTMLRRFWDWDHTHFVNSGIYSKLEKYL